MSHIIGAAKACMLGETGTNPSFGTMADLTKIEVQPSASCDVELFVASKS